MCSLPLGCLRTTFAFIFLYDAMLHQPLINACCFVPPRLIVLLYCTCSETVVVLAPWYARAVHQVVLSMLWVLVPLRMPETRLLS